MWGDGFYMHMYIRGQQIMFLSGICVALALISGIIRIVSPLLVTIIGSL